MCTCPLGRSRRPFACSSDARHAHGVFNNRYSYTSSYASARGQSDCQKTTRNGLPKPPILGVSGATNATCCAHARPCASIRIASIYISLPIAAISCPIGGATWHASTGQAPRGPHLCCHSLPSDGQDRPFRGRVPTPLVTPIVAAVSRSGMGAWAGSCGEMGWDGSVWAHSRMFTVCCTGFPRGGTLETPPGDLRPVVQCSCHLCRSRSVPG